MREVNPQMVPSKFKEIIQFLIEFVKNPVQKIAHLPNWDWSELFLTQITFAVISGILAGLIKFNFYRVAFGVFLMPLVSTLATMMLTTFFYYYFQFFENRTESYKKIFTFVMLASVPFYIFQIASEYFQPIALIGFGFTSLLAVVGLTENFQVPKKRAFQIAGVLYVLVLITWALNYFL